jgi:hypothetical protein
MKKSKTLLLAGAAFLVLGGVAAAEMPSTPAEMSQTRALNASVRGGTYASPCLLNGQHLSATQQAYDRTTTSPRHNCVPKRQALKSRNSTYAHNYHATGSESGRSYGRMTEQSGVSVSPTYNQSTYGKTAYGNGAVSGYSEQRQYGGDVQRYGDNQGRYGDQGQVNGHMPYGGMGDQYARTEPRASMEGSVDGRGTYEQSNMRRGNFSPDDFVALRTVDPDRLNGASVETSQGISVGRVSDISLSRDGTPSEVEIALNDGRRVRVSQSALRYNPNDRILLTSIDQGELQAMAGQSMSEPGRGYGDRDMRDSDRDMGRDPNRYQGFPP